jgi:hypothetical protein
MRRTIHGRRFDTDVSTLIGSCKSGAPIGGDSSSWEAGLYITPQSRRFFLAGSGGIMSRWRGKEGIFELTGEEACAWIEEHLGKGYLDDLEVA